MVGSGCPTGRWRKCEPANSDDDSDSDDDKKYRRRTAKYSPKHKHGKPVGMRETVEKYLAIGVFALERDFKGGKKIHHSPNWCPAQLCVNQRHFDISIRVWGYKIYFEEGPRRDLVRREAKEAVRDGLRDFEDDCRWERY